VQHRDQAIATGKQYRTECKKAREGAERIKKASDSSQSKK